MLVYRGPAGPAEDVHKSYISLRLFVASSSHESAHGNFHSAPGNFNENVNEVVWSGFTWSVFTCSAPRQFMGTCHWGRS